MATIIKPSYSVIIPCLNEQNSLPKLLSDLAAQTFTNFEVIIVDGKSTDQTIDRIAPYKEALNLQIITSDVKQVCTQRNLGASHANSDMLLFSDADNRLPPYFMQGLKYRTEANTAQVISFYLTPDVSTPQNENIAKAINTFLELQNNIKPTYLLEALFAIDKKVFDRVGGFDESVHYAEGKSLIQSVNKLGYKSLIFKDPTYTFSFRRFRKYGVLSIAARLAQMELAELFGPDFHSKQAKKLYPMIGGTLFSKPKKAKNKFLKNIQKILKDF